MNADDAIALIVQLDLSSKIKVVRKIIDSLVDEPLTDQERAELEKLMAWEQLDSVSGRDWEEIEHELDRRMAEDAAHPERGVPWEVVEAEAASREELQ